MGESWATLQVYRVQCTCTGSKVNAKPNKSYEVQLQDKERNAYGAQPGMPLENI